MEQPATFQPDTSKTSPFRLVCFTEHDTSRDMGELAKKFDYLCYGEEIAPTTGKKHFQGYAYKATAQKFGFYKKAFGNTHFEKCHGNLEQNDRYCKKEGKWTEFGTKPMGNGKKRVLLQLKEEIEKGERVSKLQKTDEFFEPILRYERGLRDYERRLRQEKAIDDGYKAKTVTVFIGPPGTGKTKYVYDEHDRHSIYAMPKNDGKWFGTYDGQPVVLFDDVSPGDIMSISTFLRLTDGYPIEVEVKGGFTPWIPTHIYVTSNKSIMEWWPGISEDHYLAIQRRCTSIIFK